MRVVIDPNVLVSAVITPTGTPGRVVRGAFSRRFTLVVCPHLLDEVQGVLERHKFRRYLTPAEVTEYVENLRWVADVVDDPREVESVTRDPDDDYLVALARGTKTELIVSGDPDLLDVGAETVHVVTPRQFLDEMDTLGTA